MDASFDLFTKPPTEEGISDYHDQEIHPLTALSGTSTAIDFNIAGEGDEYIDLSECRLHIRAKVEATGAAGATLADGKIELIKYWPHSLFRQCDLFLNGTLVTTSSNLYNYTAFVASHLSFPKNVKDYQLNVLEHAEGWKVKQANPENEAYIRLHLPLCNQTRFIPNGVTIKLRFLRASDEFILKRTDVADTTSYKIKLDKCSLFVRRVTPTPSLLLEHTDTFSKINCLYPIDRVWPKFFTLSSGVREFDLPNISQGQLPSRIIVGLVSTKAFSGSLDTDPYKFENFGLDYFSLMCNGKSYPAVPITTDYSKDFCRRAYHLLLDTLQGPCVDNESIGLTLEAYKTNSCFYGISLSKVLSGATEVVPKRENGYVNAKLRFAKALTENVNAIFFMEYHNFVEIDSARNIYLDFAA